MSVQRHGIIHHLAKIHRMRDIVDEVTTSLRGMVVKFEADNAFLTFATAASAIRAALRIKERFAQSNRETAKENDIEASIGIGFGPSILMDDDFYGDEVNLASKLGEELAENGEVLLTKSASKELKSGNYRLKRLSLKVSGARLAASRLLAI
jgi:adenylate cyclase